MTLTANRAAAALSLKSRESGAGRFTDFLLPPLTFYEYLGLLGESDLRGGLSSFREAEDAVLRQEILILTSPGSRRPGSGSRRWRGGAGRVTG